MTAADAPEIEALILAALGKQVAEREAQARAMFSQRYESGRTQRFVSPLDGAELGLVQRTSPKATWQVTDETALREHLAQFDGVMEIVYHLPVPGIGMVTLTALDELAHVLLEHAPHMLTEEYRITDEAIAAAVEQSKATGVAAAPGITLRRGGGQMRVVPAKDAIVAIERMVTAGVITWDGRPVLEAAQDGAA